MQQRKLRHHRATLQKTPTWKTLTLFVIDTTSNNVRMPIKSHCYKYKLNNQKTIMTVVTSRLLGSVHCFKWYIRNGLRRAPKRGQGERWAPFLPLMKGWGEWQMQVVSMFAMLIRFFFWLITCRCKISNSCMHRPVNTITNARRAAGEGTWQ